jgi:poly(3-hydroxybutyrate) depolymerase
MRRVVVLCSALVALGVPGAGAPAAGGASQAPRPDLTVSKGTVTLTGSMLTGSFSVKDKGAVKAKKSSASLFVEVSGTNQLVKRFAVKSIRPKKSRRIRVSVAVPAGLPVGSLPVSVCADSRNKVKERSERNNCRTIGTVVITTTTGPTSSVPTDPIPFTKNTVFTLNDAQSNYWVDVPTAYDSTHQTPITLFVWLHGCSGISAGDIYMVSPGGASQHWISVAVGGEEEKCWNVNADSALVLAAIANIKTHFNINPRRVIVGGYSSGGDLAYRTAFYHAKTFAGVLAENTSPFRDTGSTQSASLAAAAWKFNVVQLAHLQDAEYPITGVRSETDAMTSAGYPLTRIERDGTHYDDPGAMVNGHAVPGTTADLQTFLLPYLDAGWLSPP